MASIQKRGKTYSCIFCWQNKREWHTLGTVSEAEADAKAAQVEYLLLRLISLPPGIDVVEFVQFDGNPPIESTARPRPA